MRELSHFENGQCRKKKSLFLLVSTTISCGWEAQHGSNGSQPDLMLLCLCYLCFKKNPRID